jgi:hypothetical protein
VCDDQAVHRRLGRGRVTGHGVERREFDLLQLVERLAQRGNLHFRCAVGVAAPRKIPRDHCETVIAPGVQAGDKLGQAHPQRIAAKHVRARVTAGLRTGCGQHIQRGTGVQVEAQGRKLLAKDLTGRLRLGHVPGGA